METFHFHKIFISMFQVSHAPIFKNYLYFTFLTLKKTLTQNIASLNKLLINLLSEINQIFIRLLLLFSISK